MQVFTDTNDIISAICKYSPNRKIFDAKLNGSLEICISNDIFHEYIEILEIITVKLPVYSLPSNDPWRIVPGHPYFITSSPPPPQTYVIGEQCPNSPWSALDSVTANWSCWDTTSLDNTFYNLNPFLNVNYQVTHTPEFIALAKNEWYIYGSAGHGRFARAYPHAADERQGYSSELFVSELMDEKRYLKQKQYELKDHLGNVRVVLSDMKIPVNANDTLPPFRADVLAAYSHYPFGMLQPGMYSETGTTYRFGFNGMLRDDEVKDIGSTLPQEEGVGNSYDFGARMYDPRVGRFFSLDPMKTKFPWQSPYLFADNNPANKIDVEGKWAGFVHHYILDAAMDGIDPQLVAKLKLGSDYADSEKYQSSQYNNNHAMMDIGQTMDAYKEGVNGFLNRKMDLFVTSGNISELSMGLHCVMDMTCPSHLGQVWNGWTLTNPFKNLDEAAIHTFWDFNLFGISNNEVEQAEKNVQTYYDKAVNKRNEYILNHPELENKELFIDDLEDRKKEDALEKENKEKKSTNSNGNNKPD